MRGFHTGKSAPKPAPLVGPMIFQLGAYVTPLASHELALRCRVCSEVFRSSEDGETHGLLRAHWTTGHAEALAVLAPKPAPKPASIPVEKAATLRFNGLGRVTPAAPGRPARVPCTTVLRQGARAGQTCNRPVKASIGLCDNHDPSRHSQAEQQRKYRRTQRERTPDCLPTTQES